MPQRLITLFALYRAQLNELGFALFTVGGASVSPVMLADTPVSTVNYFQGGLFGAITVVLFYLGRFILTWRSGSQSERGALLKGKDELIEQQRAAFTAVAEHERENHVATIKSLTEAHERATRSILDTHETQTEQQRKVFLEDMRLREESHETRRKEREQLATERFDELRHDAHAVRSQLQQYTAREAILKERCRAAGCDMKALFGDG